MSSFELLAAAFSNMHKATDEGWVWDAAQQHGVGVQHHTPFERPSWGDYNLHTVRGYGGDILQGTLNKLRRVERVIYTCMDRRTSSRVAEKLGFKPGKDAFFATAGGPAQEFNESRFNMDVAFFAELLRYADAVPELVLVAHSGVCGGVAMMTDRQSLNFTGNAEIKLMADATGTFAKFVEEKSGLAVSISRGVAIVKNDSYQDISWS